MLYQRRQEVEGVAEEPAQAAVPEREPGRYTLLTQPLVRRRANGTPGKITRVQLEKLTGRSAGAPLPEVMRGGLERSLGADLSRVRVHTDAAAAGAASAVAAEAFTVGQDVYFAEGRFDPASARGRHLIAHEVAHTVQQGDATVSGDLVISEPQDADELAADRLAERAVAGGGEAEAGARADAGERRIITPDHAAAPRLVAPVGLRVARFPTSWSEYRDWVKGVNKDINRATGVCPAPEWESAETKKLYDDGFNKAYGLVPEKKIRLADGSLEIAGIPLDFDLDFALQANAGMSGRAMAYLYKHEELDDDRPDAICGEIGGMNHRGKVLTHVGAEAFVNTGLKISGSVNLLMETIKAGFEADVSFKGNAKAHGSSTWEGEFMMNGDKPRIPTLDKVTGDLGFAWDIEASAGIKFKLELGLPKPIEALFEEVDSWPVIGWFVPKPPRWKHETKRYPWVIFHHQGGHDLHVGWSIEGIGGNTSRPLDLGKLDKSWFQGLFDGGNAPKVVGDDHTLDEDLRKDIKNDTLGADKDDARAKVEVAHRVLTREQDFAKDEKKRSTGSYADRVGEHAKTLTEAAKGLGNLDKRIRSEVQNAMSNPEPATRGTGQRAFRKLGEEADRFTTALETGKLARPIDDGSGTAAMATAGGGGAKKDDKPAKKGDVKKAEAARRAISKRLDDQLRPVAKERTWVEDELERTAGIATLKGYRGKLSEYATDVDWVENKVKAAEAKLAKVVATFPDDYDAQQARYEALGPDVDAIGKRLLGIKHRPERPWDTKWAVLEPGRLLVIKEVRGSVAIRQKMYGSSYRDGTYEWRHGELKPQELTRDQIREYWAELNGMAKKGVNEIEDAFRKAAPRVKAKNLYWYYDKAKSPSTQTYYWIYDDKSEQPTIDHEKHTVGEHWNAHGHKQTQEERRDFYNGEQKGGRSKNLRILPKSENSSRGADPEADKVKYEPDVTVRFRGPKS